MAIEDIRHFVPLSGRLATAGQPSERQLEDVAREGFETVVNLGLLDPRYCLADEAGLVESLGMAYHHIPVDFKAPQLEDLGAFFDVMDLSSERRVFVHCAANYRVSVFVALYGQARLGWSVDQADAHIRLLWEPDKTWQRFIDTSRRLLSDEHPRPSGVYPREMPVGVDRCRTFRRLHERGCFVIPNPWDLGSARLLAQLGFPALATTSSGVAWSMGRADHHVSLDEMLAHLRSISQAVTIPVNADFENGYADNPDDVGVNVLAATSTGIAGLSIEDSTGDPERPLIDFTQSVARITAARKAIDASGTSVLLTARSEGFIVGRPDLEETIKRLRAFAEAGADCLYAPGLRSMTDIRAVVAAVAPKPVNVLVGSDFTTVAELAEAGVRRVSVGGALARAAWTGFLHSAREIAEHGTFTSLARAVPFAEINRTFGS